MPRVVDVEPEQEVSLPEQTGRTRLPLIKATVVYFGNKRNKSVTMKGRIMVERLGEGDDMIETRTPVERSGMTVYDFATHNSLGRPLAKELFIPANDPDPVARGKRKVTVEHPEHLWAFQTDSKLREGGEPVFKIRAAKPMMTVIQEYFAGKARATKRTQRDYDNTAKQ